MAQFQYQVWGAPVLPQPNAPPVPAPDLWRSTFPDQVPHRRYPADGWLSLPLGIVVAPAILDFGQPRGYTFALLEQATGRYQAQLVGADGVTPLPGSLVTSLTLTLYVIDQVNGALIVNGRYKQSLLNQNNGTVSPGGVVTWQIQPADTTLLDGTLPFERHIGLLEWTWRNGGAGKQEILLIVRNLRLVN